MKLTKQILKYQWIKSVKRENSPLLESILRIGANMENKELIFKNQVSTLVIDGEVYARAKHYNRLKNKFIKLCKRDIYFFKNYLDKIEIDCSLHINYAKKLSKTKFTELSNLELKDIFSEYINQNHKIASHLWPILMPDEWLIGEINKEIINYRNNTFDVKRIIYEITASEKPSAEQRKKIEILKLAKKIKKKKLRKNDIIKKLLEIYNKHAWISDHFLNFNYYKIEEIQAEIEKELRQEPEMKLAEIKNELINKINTKKIHYKKLNFNKRIIILSKCAGKMANARFLRLEAISQSTFILRKMFEEIEKRLGHNPARLFYHEIYQGLENPDKINHKKIKFRKYRVSSVILNGKYHELDKSDITILKKKFNIKIFSSEVIRGASASLGLVRGKVKILFSAKDINKIKTGEILVTSMTTPEYLPAMKKAGAFVTDEGGISCHAAIISRELGKPCIIGTKIATKVLRDGDYVEVDANKGIVKKIN